MRNTKAWSCSAPDHMESDSRSHPGSRGPPERRGRALINLGSTHQFEVGTTTLNDFVSRQGLAVDSVSRYFALITCIPSKSAGQKPERATGIEPA